MAYILIAIILILVIYSAPGIILANLVWKNAASKTEKIFFGTVIGLAFSCYISVTTAYFVGWNPAIIIATILMFIGISLVVKRKFPNTVGIHGSDAWTKGEFIACAASVCFVSIFLYIAFSRVGIATELGYRYSWLFGHDFINKAVNAVSLTHGVPPPHFFFAGETLRYYILSYSISALAYSILGIGYSVHEIVIVASFLQAILFIFVITQFLKTWFRTKVVCGLLALSFLLYSFYGVFFLLRDQLVAFGLPSFVLKFSGVSHLFYRFFLVEPQTVMGLMVFLVVISMMMRAEFGNSIIPVVIVGLLIGIEFGIESILGMFLVMTYGAIFLYRLAFRQIEFKKFLRVTLGGAIPTIIIYSTYLGISIFSTSGESIGLRFALNRALLFAFPGIAIISYGPAALFGILGFISLFKRKMEGQVDAFVIMGILIIFFMLTVSHENEAIFGYLKGEKILFIVLLVLSGFFFQWVTNLKKKTKRILVVIFLLVSAPALLSPFTDCYRISFGDEGGVTYVSYEDMKACDWIKQNLPKDAVVQSEPQYPGSKYYYSLIANFAERKMVVGEMKVAGTKHDAGNRDVGKRYREVKKMFSIPDGNLASEIAHSLNIDYIYVGVYERQIYPEEGLRKFEITKDCFEVVYEKNRIKIFKVF